VHGNKQAIGNVGMMLRWLRWLRWLDGLDDWLTHKAAAEWANFMATNWTALWLQI